MLITRDWEEALERDDVKALMTRIEEAIGKIDTEWLKHINIENLTETNLEDAIATIEPKNNKRWKKFLNTSGLTAGTSLVAASSGVGLGQLGLYFGKDNMTNEGAITLMVMGALLGGAAYLHNIKTFKGSAKEKSAQYLLQGRNLPRYKATFSKKTLPALALMGLLWIADSSAVGTLVQGQAKKDKTVAQIENTQGQYEQHREDFHIYLDDLQVQNQKDFIEIL
jgi:hypothetical protein